METTWDQLFSYCGSALAGECNEESIAYKIRLAFYHSLPENIFELNEYEKIVCLDVCLDEVIVQFQALGLIEPGMKKRAVSDSHTYWKLTSFGEKYLIQIRALRR